MRRRKGTGAGVVPVPRPLYGPAGGDHGRARGPQRSRPPPEGRSLPHRRRGSRPAFLLTAYEPLESVITIAVLPKPVIV
jgi:hypothetical protein